jgi:hypothetical protein
LPWIVEADHDTFEQELHASVPVLVDLDALVGISRRRLTRLDREST